MRSPYQNNFAKQRQRRNWLIPILLILALGLSGWITQNAVFHFLQAPAFYKGLGGLLFRLTAVTVAILSIVIYGRLLRSTDRDVLSLHPIQPQSYLWALMIDSALQTLWLPIGLAAFLTPVLPHDLTAWGLSVLLCLSSWVGGLGVAFAVSLGAVWVATAPSAQPVLDALRGPNPRAQAAFIYAPGFTLLFMGLLLMLSVEGSVQALNAQPFLALFAGLPALIGGLGVFLAFRLAPSQLVRATAILHEIDARWSAVDAQSEGHDHHVYLDWLAQNSPERLRALRQGWRQRRSLAIGPWICGLLAGMAAWSANIAAAFLLMQAGIVLAGASSGLFRDGDPLWLDRAIGVQKQKVIRARFEVGLLYALGALLPVGGILVLTGAQAWGSYAASIVLALCAVAWSTVLGAHTHRPIWPSYGIGAILMWSLTQVIL